MREIDTRGDGSYVRFRLDAGDLPMGAVRQAGSQAERALQLAKMLLAANGAAKGGAVDLMVDARASSDVTGGSTVYLRQSHQGIPIYGASQLVGFGPGDLADGTQARLAPVVGTPSSEIKVTAERAIGIALHAIVDEAAGNPATGADAALLLVGTFEALPEHPSVFVIGTLEERIRAHLVWFPAAKGLTLAWQLDIALESRGEAYRLLIATGDGEILYATTLHSGLVQSGQVYALNPLSARAETVFPLPQASYPIDAVSIEAAPLRAWAAGDSTIGYSVEAFDADTKLSLKGSASPDGVTFAPADPVGQDQRILNAFYAAAMMHDFMGLLGFGPADGSYEAGAQFGGLDSKPTRVAVSSAPVFSTANWWQGTIRLGPHSSGRHTALDATVVTHEYTHGVSNRLIGGGLDDAPLVEAQSRGMAEGWSDYFACALTGQTTIGAWLSGNPANGLRRFAYDGNFPVEAANFGILASLSVYQIGELWCALLCEITRQLGPRTAPALILDGMKGLLANPNLIEGRDNLLLKIDRRAAAQTISPSEASRWKAAVWQAAAKFGLGAGAKSNGTSITGATADTHVPS